MSGFGTTHFVGIGGAGMSSMAAVLADSGAPVSGCDRALSPTTAWLAARGIQVFEGHSEHHLPGVSRVVYTGPAAGTEELRAAAELGVPVIKRGALLGEWMKSRRGAGVAGTHGKTTTTALLAAMLIEGGLDPTVVVGGVPRGWESGGRHGEGDWLVAEADEYDRSFLHLHPEVLVITGVDLDHPDIYPTLDDVIGAFAQLVQALPDGAAVIVSDDSAAASEAVRVAGTQTRIERYGTATSSEWRYQHAGMEDGQAVVEITHGGESLGAFRASLPGEHNLRNLTAAVAAAVTCGAAPESARRAAAAFGGVGRRFERIGEARGVLVVDDYAHHPDAVRATVAAAREAYPDRKLWIAFQPHTYSRTSRLMSEFAAALSTADRAYLADVYAAREEPIAGVSSEELAAQTGPSAVYAGPLAQAVDRLAADLEPGTLLITMGAGDITTSGKLLLQRLRGER